MAAKNKKSKNKKIVVSKPIKKPKKRLVEKPSVKKTIKKKDRDLKDATRSSSSRHSISGGRNRASIKVVGVGGGGGNAISRMRDSFVRGVEFIAINTDIQDLDYCNVHRRLCIGKTATRGLGTGMNPDLGLKAAEENRQEIAEALSGADLVFVTAGLGGGTGSGVSPLVADVAREIGALTVGVVTIPFSFEGGQRSKIAQEALEKLKDKVDTYIVVPNDRIFDVIGNDTSINKAFEAIDNVLRGAVQGISDLITMPGIINVDFADVRTIMKGSGSALVGVGIASGKDRGISAVRQVLDFPLVNVSIDGARGVLFGISGGRDMKMAEIHEIAKTITGSVDPTARVIFGAYYDRKIAKDKLKVTLIATGFGPVSEIKTSPTTEMRVGGVGGALGGVKEKAQERLESKMGMEVDEEIISRETLDAARQNGGASVKAERFWKKEAKEEAGVPTDLETKKDKKNSEIWDVPAFLRKRKK